MNHICRQSRCKPKQMKSIGNSGDLTLRKFMFRKPNKRIFDLALEKAGLQPDEVWYIGDQYECDVKGSLHAGLLPVWYIGAIDLPHTADKNILTVTDWNELRRRMER